MDPLLTQIIIAVVTALGTIFGYHITINGGDPQTNLRRTMTKAVKQDPAMAAMIAGTLLKKDPIASSQLGRTMSGC